MAILIFSCVQCVSLVDWQFDVLLVFVSTRILNLRLYIPWFAVCWRLGAVPAGVVSCLWVKAQLVYSVVCGGWGLMTVRNSGFISPEYCSGMCFPSR